MAIFVLSVRDRATDTYGRPFFSPSIGGAVRSFHDEMNNKESPLNKHPEDYDLYVMGNFDERTGLFETDTPRQVAVGKEQIK